jgi:NAD(P)-dependent dehydrogenase (short-subunit alcohol dehydrogenase family)
MYTAGMIWLITGTSSGLGRALARAAARRGHAVVATARDPAAIADLAGDDVLAAELDVTKPETIERALGAARERFGGLDVVVNNAGFGLLGAFEELSDGELRESFETNLFGALAVTRAALPALKASGAGVVVQLSSLVGVVPGPGGSAYVGAKAALEAMAESIAGELAPFGIRTLIVEPGAFRTEFSGRSLRTARPLADYADTIGAAARAFAASYGTQSGDPERAAAAICDAVERPDHPLRLVLGADARDVIGAYFGARLEQLRTASVTDTSFS